MPRMAKDILCSQTTATSGAAQNTDTVTATVLSGTATEALVAHHELCLLSFKQLCARLPLGERNLREQIKRNRIPHIRLPGGRRLLFDWQTVHQALLRYQRGGVE